MKIFVCDTKKIVLDRKNVNLPPRSTCVKLMVYISDVKSKHLFVNRSTPRVIHDLHIKRV